MSGQLKEVRLRIQSVTSTQQITKAMKMVSAAKLRRAQDAIIQMRPYTQKLQEMLSNIVSSLNDNLSLPLAEERPVENVLVITITSDRGTCGAYNANVIKAATNLVKENYASQLAKGNVTILPIGKKANDFFVKKDEYKVNSEFVNLFANLEFENVKRVAVYAREAFLRGEFDRVEIVYSQFINAAVQNFTSETYLPIPKVEKVNTGKETEFLFEPSMDTLIDELMPKILNTQVYKAILDAHASEHGARMTAMDKATENANDILRTLKISYNRARQAAITTELTEIVSGAAALNG